LTLLGQGLASTGDETESESPVFRDIAERLAPSVVHITGYIGQGKREPCGEATGFFVEESGLIVSVLDAFSDRSERRMCDSYRLGLSDGRHLKAKMYSVDPVLNLALLRTEPPGRFPAIPVERRVGVQPGDAVVAIAAEKSDKSITYSTGYIKAKHKTSLYGAGFADMLINTQIQLPKHAYGGPLLNADSKLIGVNTDNIHVPKDGVVNEEEGHALPVGMVQIFFKVSKAYPTSAQNWIGFSVRPLMPKEKDAAYKTLGQRAGLYIDFVWDQGPADRSGIRAGDILFKMDGTAVKDTHQLNKLLLETRPGNTAKLAVLRKDRGFISQVGVEKRPAWAGFLR
jgi:S1-C subfamily serine protease